MITLMKTLLLAGALAVAAASAGYAGGVDGGVLGGSKGSHPGSHHASGAQHRDGHKSAAPRHTKTVAPARVFPVCSPYCTGVDHPW